MPYHILDRNMFILLPIAVYKSGRYVPNSVDSD